MEKAISGQKFKFLPQDSDKSKLNIYHVKLTDDALKTFENLQKQKTNDPQNNKLQIRFNQDNGEIVAFSNGEEKSMSFSVVTIPDPKNNVCVQSVPGNNLLPVGDMEKTLTVCANDEKVIKTINNKRLQLEGEKIRKCTKEIQPTDTVYVRRSDKKKGQCLPTTLPSRLKNHPAFSKSVNQATSSPVEKPVAPTRISEPTKTTPTDSGPASRVSFSAASNNGASTKPPATEMQLESKPTLNCSENLNGGARKNGMKVKSIKNSVVAKFPLSDRIIHILALKPLTMIELKTELKKHGATDRERMAYASVCRDVAQRNSTTNEYVLSREFYRDLKLDWPLYTEEDRAVIRSLLEKLETSPVGSASNTPDLSSCPSTNSESPIGSQQPKMDGPSIDEVNYTLPASTKRRIAHAQPPSAQQISMQMRLQPSQPAQQPPPQPLQQQPKEPPKKKVRTKSAPNQNSSVQPKVPGMIKSENKQDNRGVNGDAPSAMDESCQEKGNNVSVPLSSEDYLKKYVEILTDKQRNSYKKDFDAEYDEYKILSEKTSDRTKIFRDLNAKMKSTDNVDEYDNFRNEIISEYHKLRCDTKYGEQKVRCAHLHVKLAHIKQLVTDYDQRSKSASSS